jgi:hypothetical protein
MIDERKLKRNPQSDQDLTSATALTAHGSASQHELRYAHYKMTGKNSCDEKTLSARPGSEVEWKGGCRDGLLLKHQKGAHFNSGNKYSQREDEPASSILHMRITRSRKARWVKTAQKTNENLSAWVTRVLDTESSPVLDEHKK